MARITAFSLQKLVRPFSGARGRSQGDAAAPAATPADAPVASDPERLERIAVYARAGYFNMGYTFEMFPLVGDLPPH